MIKMLGLILIGAAIAMLIVARPRRGTVVDWLRGDLKQYLHTMAMILSLLLGGVLTLAE
jgi:hypothetical protein